VREVLGVAPQVLEVALERHRLVGPGVALEAGRPVDVLDARAPGMEVALVVLHTERCEDEARALRRRGWREQRIDKVRLAGLVHGPFSPVTAGGRQAGSGPTIPMGIHTAVVWLLMARVQATA